LGWTKSGSRIGAVETLLLLVLHRARFTGQLVGEREDHAMAA
jgi:hypothetical protein